MVRSWIQVRLSMIQTMIAEARRSTDGWGRRAGEKMGYCFHYGRDARFRVEPMVAGGGRAVDESGAGDVVWLERVCRAAGAEVRVEAGGYVDGVHDRRGCV